ncbi:MAG: hypothetical protein ACJ75I_11310 [Solirubrobacterales bacterium]
MASKADRAGTYAQRLLENDYVQENILRAADSLRAAYRRASKRRVEPTRDEKFRGQVRDAALSLREAASALQTGRRKPKRKKGRRLAIVLGIGIAGAAVALAANEELRNRILGGTRSPTESSALASEDREPQVAAVT